MGREIRRVPPNWEHPREEKYDPIRQRSESRYKPLYDTSCEEAWAVWQANYREWLAGGYNKAIAKYGEEEILKDQPYVAFCAWDGQPPDPAYYRPPWTKEEATWWQVYETVSEGTPVTPPFATQEELIDYLVANGDFWDQRRREEGRTTIACGPWSRAAAEKFVRGPGFAPSFVFSANGWESGVEALYGEGPTGG